MGDTWFAQGWKDEGMEDSQSGGRGGSGGGMYTPCTCLAILPGSCPVHTQRVVQEERMKYADQPPEFRVVSRHSPMGGVTIEVENIPNNQARRIVEDILPQVMTLYLRKSKDYDGNVMAMLKLGPKASFVDLWRKVGKLKGALWDGKQMVGEQADEILADLVGHVLIILDEMNQDVK